ncbi:FIST signal transduction protein [Georhizobium sp. MAB10]|uniref:FIST signal transduction protein n=1 Tax=Georhizobium sp. MAB10 TaxID=3028319 RepID=UPI00385586A8
MADWEQSDLGIRDRPRAAPRPAIRRAWSGSRMPEGIVEELATGIFGCEPALIALFVSSAAPYDAVVRSLSARFPGVPLIGCTTAGSLTEQRYEADGAIVLAFDRSAFSFEICLLENLKHFSIPRGGELIETAYFRLLRELEQDRSNLFAMLLVDGLSRREEEIAASAYAALDEVPVFGASAGDNLHFDTTQIFYNGAILEDTALVVIGASNRQIEVFKFEHFRPMEEKLVITSADPERRIVKTINAEPAAEEYARLIGVDVSALTPAVFAANPLLARIGGDYHVRAIQKSDDQGALHFFCAVDEGIVLTPASPVDMRDNLLLNMEQISDRLGSIELVLCFDCILRRLEAERLGIKHELLPIFKRFNMIGFSTYGEQFKFLHLSQTLTGLAIGAAE